MRVTDHVALTRKIPEKDITQGWKQIIIFYAKCLSQNHAQVILTQNYCNNEGDSKMWNVKENIIIFTIF